MREGGTEKEEDEVRGKVIGERNSSHDDEKDGGGEKNSK